MSDSDWVVVFQPNHVPFPKELQSPWRGSWFLYVSPNKFDKVWGKVKRLTKRWELGYRSSYCLEIQPNGKYLICVFAVLLEVHQVKEKLEEESLEKYITEFKLISKFRNQPGSDAILGMLPFLGYFIRCVEKSVDLKFGKVAELVEENQDLYSPD